MAGFLGGGNGRPGVGMGRVVRTVAGLAIAAALAAFAVAGAESARAQGKASRPSATSGSTLTDRLAQRAGTGGQERLLVEARELVYDNDRNTVSAVGNAELHYGNRVLQADRVIYDRGTGRVYAQGNARLTEADGTVATGERFELTDDFKSGFIDSLRVEQTTTQRGQVVRARFSAPRAERIDGESTTFERGTYTACEPCKDHPERPPLWQVKARRIIHSNEEHLIYYEDATVEIGGVPVAYLPYFSSPDPTVRRETGFLAPHFVSSNTLGQGVSIPFFWAIAPDYDLTVQPTFLTRQGVLMQGEFRQRLLNGSYNIRASGIFQEDSAAFLPGPLGPGNRAFRGSLESTGLFYINPSWRTGWDVAGVTDKWFLNNYRVRSESLANDYFKQSISTAFLIGQGDRSWFELRGYYFKGLSTYDWQKQQPVVGPVLDYEKRIDGPGRLGGELTVKVNTQVVNREATQYQEIPRTRTFLTSASVNGVAFPLYDTCTVFQRGACIVRGIAGTDARVTGEVSWRRKFVDDLGQVWQPFAYVRGDLIAYDVNTRGYQNPQIAGLFSQDADFVGRAMPAVGVEYRYPFVSDMGRLGIHTVEPIGQLILRPSETRIGKLPNEDAQSLVFDDTSLFDWDKFSGYDRVEGGIRGTIGAQYSITTPTGFYANALFGESFSIAGVNSFRRGDVANVGRDSGLDTRNSDYVGRLQVSPNANISFITRARFDQETFGVKRFEAGATANFAPFAPLTASLLYARYEPQPELGFARRREGVQVAATYSITPNYFVSGSALVDLRHYLEVRDLFKDATIAYLQNPVGPVPTYQPGSPLYLSSFSAGVGYRDECTTVSLNYIVSPRETATGTRERNQTVLLRLELRTLGEANFRQSLSTSTLVDGLATR